MLRGMAEPALAWNPPDDVRAAIAAVRVREAQGSPEADGRPVQLSPLPGVQQFAAELRARFPAITSVGLRAGAAHHNPGGARDLHEEGRAADAMVPSLAAGEPIANYVSRNAQVLGVQGVIWRRGSWWSDGRGFRAYNGTSPHTDHVHIEVGPDAAQWSRAQVTAAFQQADRATGVSPWWWALGGALLLGAAALIATDKD